VKKPFSLIVRPSALSAARPVAHKVEETIFSDNPLPICRPLTKRIWCGSDEIVQRGGWLPAFSPAHGRGTICRAAVPRRAFYHETALSGTWCPAARRGEVLLAHEALALSFHAFKMDTANNFEHPTAQMNVAQYLKDEARPT
jgi:hypothetical protein